ncbi:MAG: type II secretion system secretin GspD [Kofleriaceae bacterium]
MRAWLLVVLIMFACGRLVSAGPPTPDEDEALYSCKKAQGSIVVTLKPEADLKDLVTWAMSFSCKNFTYRPDVAGGRAKVQVVAPGQMSARQAYRVFLGALASLRLTVVRRGATLEIVETATAKSQALPIFKSAPPEGADEFVRSLYRPTHAKPETIRNAFSALKSPEGDIVELDSLLLITDSASQVREMFSLARLIDVPGGSDGIYTIPLQHAEATAFAGKLEQFLGPSAKSPRAPEPNGDAAPIPSKIMVDERTNTLVLAGSEAAYLRVKALVDRLDLKIDSEGGATYHVYPLRHAVAEELAPTLTAAIQSPGPTPAKSSPATGPAATGGSANGSAMTIDGTVRVVANKPTNALIVMSSGRDYLAIKEMITKLDLPRRQVFIEAMILEVAVNSGHSVGGSAHGAVSPGTDRMPLLLGGIQTDKLKSTSATTLTAASGLVGGLLGDTSNLLGLSIPSYGVLFQAVANASDSNVLALPSVIALDNEETKYSVGKNIGVVKGVSLVPSTETAGGFQARNDIERRDLLLELNLKPHITEDNLIQLEVKHAAEDLLDNSSDTGPTWAKRNFETRVVVRDQQTVVIGGLLQEKEMRATEKVPFLGDIPLLGYLFKYSTTRKEKTNLVILLTPYIIKDQVDLQAIRERKLREHEEFTRSMKTLGTMKYLPSIDYRRKRGLVEEINRAVLDVDDERAARAALRPPATVPSGPVE